MSVVYDRNRKEEERELGLGSWGLEVKGKKKEKGIKFPVLGRMSLLFHKARYPSFCSQKDPLK